MTILGPISWTLLAPVIGGCLLILVPKDKVRVLHAVSLAAVSGTKLEIKLLLLALGIAGFITYKHLMRAIRAVRAVRDTQKSP